MVLYSMKNDHEKRERAELLKLVGEALEFESFEKLNLFIGRCLFLEREDVLAEVMGELKEWTESTRGELTFNQPEHMLVLQFIQNYGQV